MTSYDPAPGMHWAVLAVSYTDTGTGGKIIAFSDKPVHLWKVWKTIPPNKLKIYKTIRGIQIFCDLKFTFSKPYLMEQQEAGDTLIHTFIQDPWPACTTHWWYFTGTIGGMNSPSHTAMFKYHRTAPPYGPPVTEKFYPTLGHAGIAADGRAYRGMEETWSQLRNGLGTAGTDTLTAADILIGSSPTLNKWTTIMRAPLHFDTTLLPVGAFIQSAKVGIYAATKNNAFPWLPTLALVNSNDPTPGIITKEDYQQVGTILLAPKIPYNDYIPNAWHSLIIDPTLFTFITPGGVTKFAIREGTYDLTGAEPPWASYKSFDMRFYNRDRGLAFSPYLEVTYQPPG